MRYARLVVSLIFATFAALAAVVATATSIVPSSAPRGARVVVAGTGLDAPDVSVGFADSSGNVVPSQIVSRSATVIEVAVPRTAATGSVRVTSGGATIATLPFTVTPDAAYVKVATLAASDSAHDVFQEPSAAAVVMPSGNILVADRLHHRIAIVQPNGVLSPLAGNGNPGLADGAGAAAQFKEPQGIAIDPARSLIYVADTGNNVIRRVTFDGIVTTLAGSGQGAFADGLGTQASFKQPIGLAVDAIGNLYVADTGNSAIRLVTPAGAVSTIAGGLKDGYADGPLAQALFRQPQGVAVSPSGAIYVADSQNNVIRKIEGGAVSTIAGDGHSALVDGSGTIAEFKQPAIIALDEAGNILVADEANSAIRKITLSATGVSVTTISGATGAGFIDGSPASAQYKQPAGLASFGPIYVADSMNNALRVIYQALAATAVYPTRGPLAGGNTIRVFGTGFVPGATQVTIGGVAATQLTFASSTELFVTVPAGPSGTVDVAVTTPIGTGTLAGAYTYLPPPTITSVTPIKGSTTGGQLVTVTGANFSTDAVVTLGGAPVASLSVPNNMTLTFSTPANVAGPADLVVATLGGRTTKTAAFTYFAPPTITTFTPAQGSAGTIVTITGTNFDPDVTGDAVTFGSLPAPIASSSSTQLVVTVPAGATNGKISVTTAGGSVMSTSDFSTATVVGLSVTAPTRTLDAGSSLQLNAIGLLSGGGGVDVTRSAGWSSSGSGGVVSPSGVLSATTAGPIDVTATLGTMSATIHLTVSALALPPDPVTLAPKLSPAVVSLLNDEVSFLYTGPSPIQHGVSPGVIDPDHVTVLHGRVLRNDGTPISGVTVRAVNHAELGATLTRDDGRFDFAVNGGGTLTLAFEKNGYLPAQRAKTSRWGQQTAFDDITLLAYDANVTTIASNASTPQVARGSVLTDASGTRQATLVFPGGTAATLVLADGTRTTVPSLSVRATEYTLGTAGPSSMPATLPPTSGYTYCVELSADEATSVGATSITFSKPVAFYVDNFLNMPTGMPVPVGSYDRTASRWIGSTDGVVIKVLSITNSLAQLDLDGDGVAESDAALAAIGIDSAERQQIATLYAPGKTFWRARITHFTPYDMNWSLYIPAGVVPGPDAAFPNQPAPQTYSQIQDGCTAPGSIIDCNNRTLGESVPIVGTPFELQYDSGRVAAANRYSMRIQVTGATLPPTLAAIEVSVQIAGQRFREQLPVASNQSFTFIWDGLDAYGRRVQGTRDAAVSIIYFYPGFYAQPAPTAASSISWGLASGRPTLVPARQQVPLTQDFTVQLGQVSAAAAGFGGWTFSPQHFFDGRGRVVYEGASVRGDDVQSRKLLTISAPLGSSTVHYPVSVAPSPDGSLYASNGWLIWRIDSSGAVTAIAGSRDFVGGFTPDGVPLQGALINGWDIAFSPDGIPYFNDLVNRRVRAIIDGKFVTVAGGGSMSGDGIPATQASIGYPRGIAFGPDGTLYMLIDYAGIYSVRADGILRRIAGDGLANPFAIRSGDGGPATSAKINTSALAVGSDGTVYFTDYSGGEVRSVTPDGIIHRIAGVDPCPNCPNPPVADGQLATSGSLGGVWGIAVGPDGTVFVGETLGYRVRAIGADGIIRTIAGTSKIGRTAAPSGTLALAASVSYPWDLKFGPDGSLYVVDGDTGTIRRLDTIYPAASFAKPTRILAAQDGSTADIFEGGRHARTVDTVTGVALLTFGYDSDGLLANVTDADGNVTTIARDGNGNPTAIIAPGGQTTSLGVSNGNLASLTKPGGNALAFGYNDRGLLTSLTDLRGGLHTFTYDGSGLLVKDDDPAGGSTTLTASGSVTDLIVTRTTAEGRSSVFEAQNLVTGMQVRTNTSADNVASRTTKGGDGAVTTTSPDAAISLLQVPDSRFGMMSPMTATASVTTGSHTLSISHSRSVSLSDPQNPLSLTSITDSITRNAATWTTRFTAATRTLTMTAPTGRSATSLLDSKGRPTSFSVPGISPVTATYNDLGQLIAVGQGTRSSTFGYDSKMRMASATDALHRSTTFAYDDADRLTAETLPDGRVISFTYDAADNLTSVTPPGRPQHSFAFTAVDLQSSYTPPALPFTGATQYTYNKDRQLTLITRPDATTIAFGYDTAGRLATLTTPLGTESYSYDGATGKLTSAATPDGNSSAFTYDGSLLSTVAYKGTVAGTIGYSYDSSLREASESVNGSAIAFTYDGDDLLAGAGPMTLTHDAQNGLLTGTTLDSVSDFFTYDAFGDPIGYTATFAGAPLFTESYVRDDAGRITQKTTNYAGVTTIDSYAYDAAGRLNQATTPSGTTTYAYDDNGNRIRRTTDSSAETATYDAQDRLLTYAGATYAYSGNGELLSRTDAAGTTTYTYDVLGNLRHVGLADGRSIDYVIDAENRRVAKQVNGVMVKGWLYSGSRIVAETDSSGTVVSRFVYASRGNVPDYMLRSGSTYRIVSDHLGSPRVVVDAGTGTIVWNNAYDEFGRPVPGTPELIPFGFAGGLWDADTELLRYGARDYDPQTGRWTAKDPVLFTGGSSDLFEYCYGDPVNWIDPSGLAAIPAPPGPPPVAVPGANPGNGWKWNSNPQNSRGGSWGPQTPITGQSQPSASWDPEGHWDVDNGHGDRQRYDPEGNPITPEEAHGGSSSCSMVTPHSRTPSLSPGVIITAIGVALIDVAYTLLGGPRIVQPAAVTPPAYLPPRYNPSDAQCPYCT